MPDGGPPPRAFFYAMESLTIKPRIVADTEEENLRKVYCYCRHLLLCASTGSGRIQVKCRSCKRIVDVYLDGPEVYMRVPAPFGRERAAK